LTKIVDSSKLTARRMQGIIETIRVYWNLFIPAFPDGRTPAEAAGVKFRSWMQPHLTTCERLDKLAVGTHPVDRYSEIVGQILSEFKRGLSTPRTEAMTKIMEGLEYGPVEQPPWDTPRRPRISPKHRSSLEEPLEPPTITIPFASLYAVRNVKKARRRTTRVLTKIPCRNERLRCEREFSRWQFRCVRTERNHCSETRHDKLSSK